MTGVYVLYKGCDCIYVGAATNIEKRLNNQHPLVGKFDRYEVHLCEFENLQILEQQLIDRLTPPLNKHKAGKITAPKRFNPTISTVLRFPTVLIDQLEQDAKSLRRSKASILIEIVEKHYENGGRHMTPPPSPKKKAGTR